MNGDIIFENQDKFREDLMNEWDDVTNFIINAINKYQH